MDKVIIHPREDGGLVFTYPCDCGIPVQEIARKDVPPGKPFIVLDASDLPEDRTYMDAWTADFSNPDGYGIGPEAWFAEQEGK